ncbi:MAG: hypothetical protein ACKVX9_10180 [Blastocatellia bacterium]
MTDDNPSTRSSEFENFNETFSEFEQLLDQFCELGKQVLASEGEREKIEILAIIQGALVTQARSVGEIFLESYSVQDQDLKGLADRFLRSTGVREMMARTKALMEDTTLNKRSIFGWILLILEKIKKILLMLAEIFPFLKELFDLIIKILRIIENLLINLAHLFGEDVAKIADNADQTFWKCMGRYWEATAQLERKRAAMGQPLTS